MMFDLELNITSWCDYLRASGTLSEDDIVELDNHLRDLVDELVESGLSEDEAFFIAVKRLGNVTYLSEEYSKVNTEEFWKQLQVEPVSTETQKQGKRDILLILLFSFLAGTIAKIPTFFGLELDSLAYFKNLSFYIMPFIALLFALKRGMTKRLVWPIIGIFVATAVVVNLYPSYGPHHTETLAGIHLPIMLWLVTGIAYMGDQWKTSQHRMNFLRFTGESIIYGSLILLGFMVLMLFTAGIFQSISIDIEPILENYLLIYGGCAAAMITVYLVETKKSVVENFAPVLAKIFSPLFFVAMLAFLLVVVMTGESPFAEREFLIGFDLMLVLVLGMVLYTISARNIHDQRNPFDYMNVALIIAAIVVDIVALSAIAFRLSEYGISPNKLAALGENILLLVNLSALLWLYIRYFRKKVEFKTIEIWQTKYLTVYAIWMAVVVFVFPLAFGFH